MSTRDFLRKYAYVYCYVVSFFLLTAAFFRQSWWHRGFRSYTLCAGLALLVYELAIYGTGLFLGLTYWSRFGVFFLTWVLSFGVMLALYPLIRKIQKIGGEQWRE